MPSATRAPEGHDHESELYQASTATGPDSFPLTFRPHLPGSPSRKQIAQYTCIYDALYRTVDCKPFVRTFMKQANGLMSEVTTFVNAGSSLPRGGLPVPPEARSER